MNSNLFRPHASLIHGTQNTRHSSQQCRKISLLIVLHTYGCILNFQYHGSLHISLEHFFARYGLTHCPVTQASCNTEYNRECYYYVPRTNSSGLNPHGIVHIIQNKLLLSRKAYHAVPNGKASDVKVGWLIEI